MTLGMNSRLVNLLESIIIECSRLASTTSSSTNRDLITLRSRLAHEGLSFATITLPNFSRDFFRALEKKKVTSDLFIGWKKRLCLPAFLQGFTKLVFDETTGDLLEHDSIEAIRSIRQICNFVKKVALDCTDERVKTALQKYANTDLTLDKTFCDLGRKDLGLFTDVSHLVVGSIFYDFDPSNLMVHHGPGATADGLKGNRKYIQRLVNVKPALLKYFPIGEGILYNSCESELRDSYLNPPLLQDDLFCDDAPSWCENHLHPAKAFNVKVVTVPKTLKTPRVIALEPTFSMLIQQSIKDYIVSKLEEHYLTKGSVNFRSQEINKTLALESSFSRRYATLDLSEASDRVHNELVKLMFDSVPTLNECLQLSRSEKATLPDGSELELNKFASMGSALCFPVESLFFFIVILCARIKYMMQQQGHTSVSVTLALIKRLKRDIFVYGDDLIVPTDEVEMIIETLTRFGNVVGLDKSYIHSCFRESCGTDAYKGIDITPVYLRALPCDGPLREHAADIVSLVSTANLLFDKGYWSTASLMRTYIEEVTGSLPVVEKTSAGLGWIFGDSSGVKTRWHWKYQELEVLTLVPSPIYKKDFIDGYPALFKSLLNLERKEESSKDFLFEKPWRPSFQTTALDELHLERTARPYVLKLKRRFVRPY